MRKTACFYLGIFLINFAIPALAQPSTQKTNPADSELNAIRQAAKDFESAFNKGNFKAIAELWTEDGEYVSETGEVFRGRDEIANAYKEFFANHKGLKIKVNIHKLRLLSDSAAMEEGNTVLEPAPEGQPVTSHYTVVHVKKDGKWLMSSVRDESRQASSNYQNVAHLEWLVGSWVAEEHGVKTESDCKWIANKSFLKRSYTTTQVDQTKTSGIQIIGYNSRLGLIQSWNFSPDGGVSTGNWIPDEQGWLIQTQGQLPNGQGTSAIIILTRLDENAISWQSVGRTVGETMLPDTDEIVIKRQN